MLITAFPSDATIAHRSGTVYVRPMRFHQTTSRNAQMGGPNPSGACLQRVENNGSGNASAVVFRPYRGTTSITGTLRSQRHRSSFDAKQSKHSWLGLAHCR